MLYDPLLFSEREGEGERRKMRREADKTNPLFFFPSVRVQCVNGDTRAAVISGSFTRMKVTMMRSCCLQTSSAARPINLITS